MSGIQEGKIYFYWIEELGNFNNEYVDLKKQLVVNKSYSQKNYLPSDNNANNNYNLNNYQKDNINNYNQNLKLPDSKNNKYEKIVTKKKK